MPEPRPATRRRRAGALPAVAAVLALLLAACSPAVPDVEQPGVSAGDSPGGGPGPGSAAPEDQGARDAPEGLEEFYSQQLDWSACDDHECATLQVPVDYADPDGGSIELALLRVPAGGERQGALVVNPGGPGSSGVEYAQLAGLVVSPEVSQAYDVVGFDPRGVAGSAPITCVDDAALDELLGADPTPDSPQEEAEVEALVRGFVAACEENAGALLPHVSTVEVARDLDVLRAALGQDRLDYLGASYGTFIGATYAELFPTRVGRFVLDGAIDPALSGLEMGLGQAEGFQRAATAYAEDCVAGGDCPLGGTAEEVLTTVQDVLTGLDSEPVPVSGDTVTELTEGWALFGVIVAMYDQTGWPVLTSALDQVRQGDGTLLMLLANLYVRRTAEGSYEDNGMQVIYAVNCLDRPAQGGLDDAEVRERFEAVSPTFGRYLAGEGMCEYWPVQPATTLDGYAASGAPPILVLGTTRDPATPYEWAVALADTLESGVLVSYDGDGHTAYGRSNDCVDGAVDAFLLEGTVPEDGLSC